MNTQNLSKLLFFTFALGTVIFYLRQCDQGRLNEAFAISDAGLRQGQHPIEADIQKSYRYLSSYVAVYPNQENQNRLEAFQRLQVEQQAYILFLDSLRAQMLSRAGLVVDKPLAAQPLKDCRDVVQQVLLNGAPNGLMQVVERTGNLRKSMVVLADSESTVIVNLPLNFTATADGRYKLWEELGNFQDLPLAGTLAILSALQATANSSMTMVWNYCAVKMDPSGFGPSYWFEPRISTTSSFVLAGDHYKADIFLTQLKITLEEGKIITCTVNGKSIPLQNGSAHFQERSSQVGKHQILVKIVGSDVYRNRNGYIRDTFRVSKTFSYTVLSPHADISQPPNFSRAFLYAGLENPVSLLGWADYGEHGPSISVKGAHLKKRAEGRYTIFPDSAGLVTLKVAGQSITYQARRLPDPKAILAGHAFGEYVLADSVATQTALHTRFPEDFNFEADCQIIDFHLTRFRPREDPEDADNTGGDFSPKTHQILESTQPGDRLFFYDIRVQCPGDKAPRMIDALSLRVR